jgi:hypothetical protein
MSIGDVVFLEGWFVLKKVLQNNRTIHFVFRKSSGGIVITRLIGLEVDEDDCPYSGFHDIETARTIWERLDSNGYTRFGL